MSEKTQSEIPKLPTVDVFQFNIKAVFVIRNPDGKAAATKDVDFTVMQTDFNTNLEFLAQQVVQKVTQELVQAQAPSPPLTPPEKKPTRAGKRRVTRAVKKGK